MVAARLNLHGADRSARVSHAFPLQTLAWSSGGVLWARSNGRARGMYATPFAVCLRESPELMKKASAPFGRHIVTPFIVAALLTGLVAAQAPAPAPDASAVTVETNVRVKMRDGVSLVADIYRPKADGPLPVLLTRTPYNRKDPSTGIFLAANGYVVIMQDTRGRFDSEGEFYPFRNEAADGYDTIEWAAGLPGTTGKVGMFGGSYVGATQM